MQAVSPQMQLLTEKAFQYNQDTSIYWLGSAGVLINSYGTTILIDPDLDQIQIDGMYFNQRNGVKMFQQVPIQMEAVPMVDAIFYTHADEDHIGIASYKQLAQTGSPIHCTQFVKNHLIANGITDNQIFAHEKLDTFRINDLVIEMTLADHPWHKNKPTLYDYYYTIDDCTGYKVTTKDGIIWHPGDSILLPEHLNERPVDLLLIDFSNDPFHFGKEGAVQLVNQQILAELIPIHWGTYESDKPCFNANPYELKDGVVNNKRLHILGIGEKYTLKK